MILGKTDQRKHQEKQAQLVQQINGRARFAFLPVKLDTGEWAWMEYYWRYMIAVKYKDKYGSNAYRKAIIPYESSYVNSLLSSCQPFIYDGMEVKQMKCHEEL